MILFIINKTDLLTSFISFDPQEGMKHRSILSNEVFSASLIFKLIILRKRKLKRIISSSKNSGSLLRRRVKPRDLIIKSRAQLWLKLVMLDGFIINFNLKYIKNNWIIVFLPCFGSLFFQFDWNLNLQYILYLGSWFLNVKLHAS